MKKRYILFLLVLAVLTARAQTIPNPSFEANSFTVSPGYVSVNGGGITGWVVSNPTWIGINYAADTAFANNGAIPNGTNVAFIQCHTNYNTLSTTISGLTVGATYQVTFRANCRSGYNAPSPTWSLNGGTYVTFTASPAVGGSSPYYTNSGVFTATAATAPMVLANNSTSSDTTVLLDNFLIATLPTVTTTAATSIAATNATFNGTINPNGTITTNWFLYGLTTNYGNYTATNILSAGTTVQSISRVVNGLAPGTAYHYKLAVANSTGTVLGGDQTFTTAAAAPVFGTVTPTTITSNAAAFMASANPEGAATGVYFQYGFTTNYGSYSLTNNLVATNVFFSVSATLTGLAPGTVYHCAAVGHNSIGTVLSGDQTFTTTAVAPVLGTVTANAISATNAAFVGSVNPEGAATTVYFQYGLTTSYGSYGVTNSLTATNAFFSVSNVVAGLMPATMYHAQIVGSNSMGTIVGSDLPFTTPNAVPAVTTLAATGVTATNATVNGTVNPNGAVTAAWFQYGLTTSYGSYTTTNTLSAGNATLSVSNLAGGLLADTTYHYELVGSNTFGTVLGGDQTLVTAPAAPVLGTVTATALSATNAAFVASVNPEGAATMVYFQYGLDTNYGSDSVTNLMAAANAFSFVPSVVAGLAPATTYHVQVVSVNSAGATVGSDLTFTTPSAVPAVTTLDATDITTNEATLDGTVNPNGAITTAWFQYGLTTNYGNYTATNTLSATNTFLSVSGLAGGLSLGTTYHYELVGSNSFGMVLGGDLTFLTAAIAPVLGAVSATTISSTTAAFVASVNPGGAATTVYFQYGLTTNYGSYSVITNLTATNAFLSVSNLVSSLLPGAIYHAQIVSSNSVGITLGTDLVFTTPTTSLAVITLPANNVSLAGATLNGTVNPGAATTATTTYFEYGADTNYGDIGAFVLWPGTNAIFAMPGTVVSSLGSPAGTNWMPSAAPTADWQALASSSDGTRLVAAINGSGIYTSTNGGSNWTLSSAPSGNWSAVASSADGTQLAAAVNGGGIYVSTNAGGTWTQSPAPATNWQAIASSADGTRLAAAVYGGGIYNSPNAGGIWTQSPAPATNWSAIATSVDGSRLVAVVNGGGIYTSTNSGTTWTTTIASVGAWQSVASSANGLRLAAALYGGGIYTSVNGGTTWSLSSSGNQSWWSLASSADGTRLAAAVFYGGIYTSTNGGTLWKAATVPTSFWWSIASSADGTRLAAAIYGDGGIYTSVGSVSNLAPATTYHFQLVGVNATGSGLGGDLAFTTPSTAPSAATLAANGVGTNGATLNGSVNPNGAATTVYFQYGLTTGYGSTTVVTNLAPTNAPQTVSNVVSGLLPGVLYHYQVVSSNLGGVTVGNDLTFTTVSVVPLVMTLAAASVTPESAVLNGSVDPDGAETTAYLEYGANTNYGDGTAFIILPAVNSTFTLPGALVSSLNGPAGAQWTLSSAPTTNAWRAIASSADGTQLAAANGNGISGSIYTSTNSGGIWTLSSAPLTNWYGIASSADGTRLAAVAYGIGIYASTNGGATWAISNTNRLGWQAIASSSDGTRLAALAYGGGVYVSTNGGGTWAISGAPNLSWESVASSSDGMRLAAGGNNNTGVYVSTNGGGTWALSGSPNANWSSLASSGDGTRLIAGEIGGGLYVSTNGGGIWTAASVPTGNWYSAVSSWDGTRLAAALGGGSVYTSTNGGATWAASGAPVANWYSLASSADGTRLAGGANTGGIYTSAGVTNPLVPNTTYHFQLVGINSLGTVLGGDMAFTTTTAVPAATTLPANAITTNAATLNGTVNPSNSAASVYFQFGLTTNYGSYTTTNLLAVTNGALAVTSQITNLPLGTAFHFQLVAANSAGTSFGADSVFVTAATAPTVTTLAATGVTATNATLNGLIDPNGLVTTAYFQYGLDTNYGDIGALVALPAPNFTYSPAFLMTSISGAAGAQWTQSSAPTTNIWRSLASSADGTRLAAVGANNGGIYTSTNSGGAWTLSSAPFTNWNGIASSADGTRLAAAAISIGIFTSTNGGANWTEANTNRFGWEAIASSVDGTRLVAVLNSGGIYVSTNGGGTWANSGAPNALWECVASSADGTRLAAAVYNNGIYTSTNGGGTWALSGAPTNYWLSLASSGDGSRLVAGSLNTGIYVSTNAGATWSGQSLSTGSCYGLASSFDGSRLTASIYGGGIYASTNGGATWAASSAPNAAWYSVASSADGTQLAAGANGAGIYTSTGSSSAVMPATTYHYQLVGVSALGTVLGGDQTFTTAVAGPVAVTLPANGLAVGTATLNGTVNPSGLATTAYFQFGLTTNYGSFTTTNLLAAATTPYSVTNQITNLGIGIPYHFQIVAVNSAGVTFGADSVFVSMGEGPVVTTLPATGVTAANATLNGSVDPNGPVTTAYFQYGLDTNYGTVGGLVVLPATNFTFSPAFLMTSFSGAAGAQWTESSLPTTNAWRGMASSADGTRLAVVAANAGGIYLSTNGGGAWTLSSAPLTNWIGIASSADGTRLAAVVTSTGGLYTSTNGGANWTEANTNRLNWQAIASSADGTRLVAVPNSGGIYISTNGGGTWTNASTPTAAWESVASSADGTRLAAGGNNTGIYVSTNGGGTWTLSGSPTANWNSLASSGDGTRLLGGEGGGLPYVSTNGGATWAAAPVSAGGWYSTASSFDGTRLAAAIVNGGVYTSTNAGATWAISGSPNVSWYSLASSADGTRLAGGANIGGVYTSAGVTTPVLPDTTYHYQLVGVNNLGTGLGGDLAFTTPNGPPVMATLAATSIGATNATLNGTVNAGNLATMAWFQYGVTTNYTGFSATNLFAATNVTVSLSSLVASFSPATVWHFQFVGANSAGTSFGSDLIFTSTIAPPTAVTLAASAVAVTNAALNGTVNPNGAATIAWYQYGVDTNYGDVTAFTFLPATNTALTMPSLAVSSLTGVAGAQWTQSGAPDEPWFAIASSSDGTHLAALVDGGGIYTSPNGGNTWTLSSAPAANWQAIASSADGTHLAAAVYGGGIYTSTDGGNTWPLSSAITTNNWQAIASSADGTRLLAVVYGGGVYLSTNSGAVWTKTPSLGNANYQMASSSADGTHLVTAINGGSIYTSTNGGTIWSVIAVPQPWRSVAASADGTHLAAVATGSAIYVSTNSGYSWTPSSAPIRSWWSIASSADGRRLAAAVFGGGIYTSTNSGSTWAQSGAPGMYWWSLASSADGTRLAAVVSGDGGIYTSLGAVTNLAPSTTCHYQLVGVNSMGTGLGGDMTFTTLQPVAVAMNFTLTGGLQFSGSGAFQLTFTNNSGLGFTVLATTNLTLPFASWTVLGPAVETPPGSGNYQFTDPSNTNNAAEFYRVTSP